MKYIPFFAQYFELCCMLRYRKLVFISLSLPLDNFTYYVEKKQFKKETYNERTYFWFSKAKDQSIIKYKTKHPDFFKVYKMVKKILQYWRQRQVDF